MHKEIFTHLQDLVRLAAESDQTTTNLHALEHIRQQIGGDILTNPTDQTPLLLHTPNSPHSLWVGHIDIIPRHPQQKEGQFGNHFFSRGAYDMLGSVASFISLVNSNPQLKNSLGFLITTDEEIGGTSGAQWILQTNHIDINQLTCVLVGEPTDLNISITSKGLLVLQVDIQGQSSHASEPWKGVSASLAASKFCSQLETQVFTQPQSLTDWQTSCNLGLIESGSNHTNVIPDKAHMVFDIRHVNTDSPQQIIDQINSLLSDQQTTGLLKSFQIKIKMQDPPEACPHNHPVVKALSKACTQFLGQATIQPGIGVTDGRHFAAAKPDLPIIRFGPRGDNAHAVNEWVDLNSLFLQFQILNQLFQQVNHET